MVKHHNKNVKTLKMKQNKSVCLENESVEEYLSKTTEDSKSVEGGYRKRRRATTAIDISYTSLKNKPI
jgi:hypothetical protein